MHSIKTFTIRSNLEVTNKLTTTYVIDGWLCLINAVQFFQIIKKRNEWKIPVNEQVKNFTPRWQGSRTETRIQNGAFRRRRPRQRKKKRKRLKEIYMFALYLWLELIMLKNNCFFLDFTCILWRSKFILLFARQGLGRLCFPS